jgi:hypothetical protein
MDLRQPGQTAGRCAGVSALNGHKVDRRVLPSSVDLEIEFESVAFIDTRQTRPFHGADVDKRIVLAIVARDEAKAFHGIEELYRAGCLFAGQLPLRTLWLDGDDVTDDLEIGSGNLAAPVDQVELQLLAFGQAFEAGALHLADMDKDVLAAFIALDEAEALVSIEELHLALAGADNLGGHSAAAGPARTARTTTESPAISTAGKTVASPEPVSTPEAITATKAVSATELGRSTLLEWIEAFFAKPIPLVAPPAATPSIVTHLTNAPSFRPQFTPGCADEIRAERSTEALPPHYRFRLIAQNKHCANDFTRLRDFAPSDGLRANGTAPWRLRAGSRIDMVSAEPQRRYALGQDKMGKDV